MQHTTKILLVLVFLGITQPIQSKNKAWAAPTKKDIAQEYSKKARQLIRQVDLKPKRENAPNLLLNAAFWMAKAKRKESENRLYQRIVNVYSGSRAAPVALWKLATYAHKKKRYKKAIQAYGLLIHRYPRNKKASDALAELARLMEHTKQYQKAAKYYLLYANRYAHKPKSSAMFFRAIKANQKIQNKQEVFRLARLFFMRHQTKQHALLAIRVYGVLQQATITKKLPKRTKLNQAIYQLYRKVKGSLSTQEKALIKDIPARSAYELAMLQYQKFSKLAVKITNMRRQRVELKAKIKALQHTKKLFSQVMRYKSRTWTVCSLFRMAKMNQKMAETFSKMPLPPFTEKNQKSRFAFKIMIQNRMVIPFQRRAIRMYQKGIVHAQNHQHRCVKQIKKELAQLKQKKSFRTK